MLNIKSLQNKNNTQQSKNKQDAICSKNNIQIQCTLGDYSTYSQTLKNSQKRYNQKYIKYSSLTNKIVNIFTNTSQQKYHKYAAQNTQKLIYKNIEIRNINKQQQSIINILQSIALGRKIQQKLLALIKKQNLILKQYKQNIEDNKNKYQQITINIQILFKCYLQLHQKLLKKSNLQGKTLIKIIKPFLVIYHKLKQKSDNLYIKCQNNKAKGIKIILKQQLNKMLLEYQPKSQLQRQIKQSLKKQENIYQRLYEQYDKLPFYNSRQPEQIKQEEEQNIQQNQSNHQNQEEKEHQIKNTINKQNQDRNKTENTFQYNKSLKIEDMQKSPQFYIHEHAQQMKQRFQQRFKRQLENLTNDVNMMKISL